MGILLGMGLIHGGGPMRLFCSSVFNFLCGINPTDIIASTDEVSDIDVREFLQEVGVLKFHNYVIYTKMVILDSITN